MSEVLWNLMKILYKRGYVEYHSSLYANALKDYNLEVPGFKTGMGNILFFSDKIRNNCILVQNIYMVTTLQLSRFPTV